MWLLGLPFPPMPFAMVDISRARIWKSVDHLDSILCSTLLWAKVCLEDWPAEGQSIDSNAEFDEMRNLIWTIYLYKDMPPPYPHPKYNSGLWNNLDEFGHLQWQRLSRYITKYLKKRASFLSVNTENSAIQTNHWPRPCISHHIPNKNWFWNPIY